MWFSYVQKIFKTSENLEVFWQNTPYVLYKFCHLNKRFGRLNS